MDTSFYQKLADAVAQGSARCLATVIQAEGSAPGKPGFKMLVGGDGSILGTVGGGEAEQRVIAAALSNAEGVRTMRFELSGQPGQKDGTNMVCGGAMGGLLETLAARGRLYILGGGDCGIALAHIAKLSGFHVTVIDDRLEWASRDRHPDADALVCAPFADTGKHVVFSPDTYVVIMTHGHDHDEAALRQCVGRECKYLGLIGSGRKVKLFLDKLQAEGHPRGALAKIFAPIGFEIGSQTPAEIAVSIAAQLIAVRSGVTEIAFSSNPLR
jgi:xanthine dehydrogenase accessory factor